jgi:hypothetical protein
LAPGGATPLAIDLERIERCRSSHTARAVRAVDRSRASAVAYGEPGPNAMVRKRICLGAAGKLARGG